MADEKQLPYMQSYGSITRGLEAIKKAKTPERFTQDFLATRLNLSGGAAKPLIPFLKRTGFLATDGSPTALYKRFRGTPKQAKAAAAEAVRIGYRPLYEINEYVHGVSDEDLRAAIVQHTGLEADASQVTNALKSFRALQAFADFEIDADDESEEVEAVARDEGSPSDAFSSPTDLHPNLRLGYTINLHLPPTSDVAVFNAIFKSLREHLLQ